MSKFFKDGSYHPELDPEASIYDLFCYEIAEEGKENGKWNSNRKHSRWIDIPNSHDPVRRSHSQPVSVDKHGQFTWWKKQVAPAYQLCISIAAEAQIIGDNSFQSLKIQKDGPTTIVLSIDDDLRDPAVLSLWQPDSDYLEQFIPKNLTEDTMLKVTGTHFAPESTLLVRVDWFTKPGFERATSKR